jgi:hypothetical protein
VRLVSLHGGHSFEHLGASHARDAKRAPTASISISRAHDAGRPCVVMVVWPALIVSAETPASRSWPTNLTSCSPQVLDLDGTLIASDDDPHAVGPSTLLCDVALLHTLGEGSLLFEALTMWCNSAVACQAVPHSWITEERYVWPRPGLRRFLETVAQKFEVRTATRVLRFGALGCVYLVELPTLCQPSAALPPPGRSYPARHTCGCACLASRFVGKPSWPPSAPCPS